ncbi:hypothetical protein E8E14_013462 [Neopestalotiopsis sp. 37M]|nr:hypothetical protein E8E14_013462 [Neopestalotiopsis sp. 37M]
MPFLDQKLESQGGQGRRWKVRMHTNHFRAKTSIGPDSAIKQFELEQRPLWKDEVKALTTLSRSKFKDKHLIRLLCAYEHEDHGLFLVFPLAEGAWRNIGRCRQIILALPKVLAGFLSNARALLLGRHGDIKPGNILWFKSSDRDRGHLVLADFTSTRFHSSDTVDLSSTGTSGITRAYCPPEVDKKPEIVRTQAYDVWSLGCVYIEFVTWYLFGNDAIRKEPTFVHSCGEKCYSFAKLRLMDDDHHYWAPEDKFFNIIHQKDGSYVPVVKQSVKEV